MMEKILPMKWWWKVKKWQPLTIGMLETPKSSLLQRKIDMLKGLRYYFEKELKEYAKKND